MTVKDIVKEYLEKNGFDGLYNSEMYDWCGCEINDLIPCCGEGIELCQPGYKIPGCSEECGEGCEWHMGPKKPKE